MLNKDCAKSHLIPRTADPMSSKLQNYYGTIRRESVSYLEFGSLNLNEATKQIWAYWQDDAAYDMYMFSRYARDLMAFRDLSNLKEGEATFQQLLACVKNSAHDKIADYLFKFAGLITACGLDGDDAVCESGSSLFGWIDEAVAFDSILFDGAYAQQIRKQKYLCSDISELMNKGAMLFHPGSEMTASMAPTITDLMSEVDKLKLFYGLGVSMRYAARKSEDILKAAEKTQLSIYNRLSLTKSEKSQQYIYGTGKAGYILSLPRLVKSLSGNGFTAKFSTENMQFNKDGDNTMRASVAISKDAKTVNKFIDSYSAVIDKCSDEADVKIGEWKDLCLLQNY